MGQRDVVHALLDRAGTGYAAAAGIHLADTPAPLFQLLMLSELLSTRISADLAVDAAKELIDSGYRTPQRVADADWQELVDALGRAHYRRYDESTASRLGAMASTILDRYDGDLRKLADEADHDPTRAAELLQQFKGIGPVGADIFLREVQDVWTWARPHFDERALHGAERVDLPTDPDRLAELAPRGHVADLAAALVRVTLDDDIAEDVRTGKR
ncbi:endonuclease [Nocardia cyriacigeorgica]|uniref:endonuclease n=1 Tax=Nocardia cyriacigeorgica TaxID=135487 RepID=UPI001894E828|nr:endonuclease [Nocardia cyriacigeorgica]MBF6453078.1 endonuclease [Nocardia cyriacigeorgica]MBF6482022.1 endonuclease [Nocardia cyriacigeorgica]MBF6550247.1 endonuclease [Nocardia cyriacigeorgica]